MLGRTLILKEDAMVMHCREHHIVVIVIINDL